MLFTWGILGLILWVIVAFWPAIVAKNKGHSFLLWFIASLFFWWITLFWVYFGLKDKTMAAQDRANDKAADKALAKEENKA